MSVNLSLIGFFQFDNLVRNRIPFLFLHEGADVAELYGSLEKEHLERHSVQVNFDAPVQEALAQLEAKAFPKSMPVVLTGRSGDRGQSWIAPLEAAGFFNVHWVLGGWDEIKKEAKASL